MRRWLLLLALAVAASSGSTAFAQDDDEIDLLDEEFDDLQDSQDTLESGDRLKEGDDLLDEDEPIDEVPPVEEPPTEDLLGEPADQPESGDTAAIYRDYAAKIGEYDADEEVAAWERYLLKYPDTAFRERIEERIETLMDVLYSEHIDPEGSVGGVVGGVVDALQAEIPFAQALLLENINPRTRIQVGFEWGLPTWINLYAGYEHAFARNFSVQGGIRHRYTGWSVEAGVRYAPVKALRTQTLVTLLADVRFNAIPSFLAVRPGIGVGKIFADVVHAQIQVGADVEIRGPVGVHLIGGANVTWMASEAVALYVEGAMDLKNLTWKDGGAFAFNTATFGIKFFPKIANMQPRALEANVGASLPVGTNYWMYHFGSVMGQANYYFPPK